MFSSTTNIRKAVGEYILDEPLFMDSFSSTYRAFHVNTCQEALVRIIETSTLSMIENSYQLMQDEVQLLRQISHPNIIRIVNTFSTKNNCYIIYEHISGGGLETYVNLSRFLPETEAIKLMLEIIGGYGELYKRNVVMKSIRLDSFVLHEKAAKFFDISIVKNFEKFKQGTFLKTSIKFWFSLAPEIYFGAGQSNRCDIWSLGIVFYQMLFGELPWRSDNIQEFFKAATTQSPNFVNKYQHISRPTLEALTRMLQPDPTKRVSFEALCNEPMFVNYYDMLQEREQKVIEKIRKNPECWQAASMMYTGDPIISILDLTDSIKSSSSKKSTLKTVDDLKPLIVQSNGLARQVLNQGTTVNIEPIWRIDQIEELRKTVMQGGQSISEALMTPSQQHISMKPQDRMDDNQAQNNQSRAPLQRKETGLSAYEKLEAEIRSLGVPAPNLGPSGNISGNLQGMQSFANPTMQMNQSMPVIGRSVNNMFDNPSGMLSKKESVQPLKKIVEEDEAVIGEDSIAVLRQSVSNFNKMAGSLAQIPQKPKKNASVQPKIFVKKLSAEGQALMSPSQNYSPELLSEFRKYTGRINYLCEFFQLYSQAASSAAKLFKTEMIIFQCFFLYKKLLKSLRVLYEAMAKGDNIFRFTHWEEYCNSSNFFSAVEILERHLEKVEDIFDKIYTDCLLKLNDKRNKNELEIMREYIVEDLDGIDMQLNSFLIPYLEKFLVSEEAMSEQTRAFLILKHRIETTNALLLNKMAENGIEEVIVSLKEHRQAMKSENIKAVKEYFNQQYKKLDLFKLNNLRNII